MLADQGGVGARQRYWVACGWIGLSVSDVISARNRLAEKLRRLADGGVSSANSEHVIARIKPADSI
jgi:hypothetical protein